MRPYVSRALLLIAGFTGSGAFRAEIDAQADLASDADVEGNPVEVFPPELMAKGYTEVRKLACGYHGCAFLASKDATADSVESVEDMGERWEKLVVIKVSDEANLTEHERLLTYECGHMRWLRYEACRAGPEMVALHESYIPTCIDVGQLSSSNFTFLIMPFAGPTQIKKLDADPKFARSFSTTEMKSMFAQMVASVYALHAIAAWHNDLNSGNLMLEGTHVALIDFGLMTSNKSETPRTLDGYGRDANSVFRWGTMFAKCPAEARWKGVWWEHPPTLEFASHQAAAELCFRNKWGVDDEFIDAFHKMNDANLRATLGRQYVQDLFATKFVQSNLPPNEKTYHLEGTAGCDTWDNETLTRKANETGMLYLPWDG